MSIVKMKKLRVIGMAGSRDELLKALQRIGCVEVDEPTDKADRPEWAALTRVDDTALADTKTRINELKAALVTLNKYAKGKGGLFTPRPVISEQALFDDSVRDAALSSSSAISAQEKRISAIYSEESKLKGQKLSLAPWLELDVPLDVQDTREVDFLFGALSARADYDEAVRELSTATELCQLVPGGKDREFQYVLAICHRDAEETALEVLKRYGFTRSTLRGWAGTARENTAALDKRLGELDGEIAQAKEAIAAESVHREEMKLCIDRLSQDAWREEIKGRLMESRSAIFFEGWVPAPEEKRLFETLGAFTCAWETEEPIKDEYPKVPVKLKSNIVTWPLNMVTEMYSLPAYDGVDPNPLIMPFFVFFFGFMFADLGYGLILVAAALFMILKVKPKGTVGYMMGLMLECGIASAIIGFFTGGFFTDAIKVVCELLNVPVPAIPFLTQGPLLDVVNDPMTVLIFCMGVGVVQIVVGMGVNAFMLIREGNWKDAIFDVFTWYIIFAGIAVFAIAGTPAVLIVGGVMILLGAIFRAKWDFKASVPGGLIKGIGSTVVGVFATLYNNVTGYFGDVLSYSRLMVMMLAGTVIGSIFNMLGSMPGNIFVFALVFVVGHIFNIGLNVIGTYVHASRLQYLEYFGKFYREGGRPFKPLNFNTKYVDIKEE